MSGSSRGVALGVLLFAGALATTAEAATDPGWTVDVGVFTRVRPDHLGSDRYTFDLLPIVSARWGDHLTASLDDGLKLTALTRGAWSFGPVVEYRQSYNDRLTRGAYRMPDAIEVGGFAKTRTALGDVELRLRKATDGYDGWSGDLSFDTGAQVTPRWTVGGEARLSWADDDFSREYFGLRRRQRETLNLPTFRQNDFVSLGFELDAQRRLGQRTAFVATLSGDRIVGEAWESPLLRTRNVLTAGVGVTYRFGRAEPALGD
ncbi:MipA/OmpV family protein [Caulobacter sp. BE254]|uniref:MipA/OmpV family protein n=1 Tax=Caulobacter sp. BE254 TaxID=2817720 RepID=UPI00286062A4|nr:MipA/OmpV family protein [Caulobacter sp. BE254]MDR7115470.1 outer membrane scaffolding protein for murein synthesis (MipA/OmpV family) [Caulobacter sp. BE254]